MSRRTQLEQSYRYVRSFTDRLVASLETEDYVIQSMPDVSPTRWHLAHTTWFFETFVLKNHVSDYLAVHPSFDYLFNSYYQSVGNQFPRRQRGHLSRPTLAEIWDYRRTVDDGISQLLETVSLDALHTTQLLDTIELGIHHEQQHQELILTDIKHVFSCNPLSPIYKSCIPLSTPAMHPGDWEWVEGPSGLVEIGAFGSTFVFDNERPRHKVYLEPYALASRLVTSGEYLEFIDAGGYTRPEFWLSLGWDVCQAEGWQAPLYWRSMAGEWQQFTLQGLRRVDPCEPVCHVSFFEADAYARWRGLRLPLEAEWEVVARSQPLEGHLAESFYFHPRPATDGLKGGQQWYGDVWEWTGSPYVAYPRYRPPTGALGEYNGKFMCNQYVLRGGSCATSASHLRPTYRNFFPPTTRWQFTGIRLAKYLE